MLSERPLIAELVEILGFWIEIRGFLASKYKEGRGASLAFPFVLPFGEAWSKPK